MKRQNMIQSVNKTKDVKQKVIIGYSHARNCAAELQHSLGTIGAVSYSMEQSP